MALNFIQQLHRQLPKAAWAQAQPALGRVHSGVPATPASTCYTSGDERGEPTRLHPSPTEDRFPEPSLWPRMSRGEAVAWVLVAIAMLAAGMAATWG